MFKPKPRAELKSTEIGTHAEAEVISRLTAAGHVVLIPFGGAQHYDMVIEDAEGNFWRIQCKKAWYRNGCVVFNSGRNEGGYSRNGRPWTRHSYRGHADYFAVYSKEVDKVYLVPVEDMGMHSVMLRVEEPKGPKGARSTIRWAADYEL